MRGACAAALLLLSCAPDPRGPCDPTPPPGVVGSVCGFHNPEDVAIAPGGRLLLVSQMRHDPRDGGGSIAALTLQRDGSPAGHPRTLWPATRTDRSAVAGDPSCVAPTDPSGFSPHGIDVGPRRADGRFRVAAVTHGARESIELFDLIGSGENATLAWRGCVRLPPGTSGNDVALGVDGAVFVSHFQPTLQGPRGLYYTIAGGLGLATGEVLAWRPGSGWAPVPGTRSANANGVLVGDDGALFVARTGSKDVLALPPEGAARPAPRIVSLPGHPDNLSRSPRGPILVAVHRQGPAVILCRIGRLPCRTAWSLFEIDPATLETRERLRHDGDAIGAVASIVETAGRFYFGTVFDDRIGVWRP